MTRREPADSEPLATLTHARLRASQGDRAGAQRILRGLLERRPGDAEARRLLDALASNRTGTRTAAVASWRRRLGIERRAGREADMLDGMLERIGESVAGLKGVFLVGMDGVIVASSPPHANVPEWEWIAASYTEILKKAAAANREGGLEAPRELVTSGEGVVLVFRAVTDEYGLLAVLDAREGVLGRLRFEMRKAAGNLVPELQT